MSETTSIDYFNVCIQSKLESLYDNLDNLRADLRYLLIKVLHSVINITLLMICEHFGLLLRRKIMNGESFFVIVLCYISTLKFLIDILISSNRKTEYFAKEIIRRLNGEYTQSQMMWHSTKSAKRLQVCLSALFSMETKKTQMFITFEAETVHPRYMTPSKNRWKEDY